MAGKFTRKVATLENFFMNMSKGPKMGENTQRLGRLILLRLYDCLF